MLAPGGFRRAPRDPPPDAERRFLPLSNREQPLKNYQLAQIKVALARDEMDSERMAGFVARLDEINAIADRAAGFVWRLQSEAGDSTAIRVFDDPLLLVNLSVWDDLQSLQHFVYKTSHVELLRDRDAWFTKLDAGAVEYATS